MFAYTDAVLDAAGTFGSHCRSYWLSDLKATRGTCDYRTLQDSRGPGGREGLVFLTRASAALGPRRRFRVRWWSSQALPSRAEDECIPWGLQVAP